MENKWSGLIEAAKRYWIDSLPTGITDSEFDKLESEALKEGFDVRQYVFDNYLKGDRVKNRWIEKIKKFKVKDISMLEALKKSADELGIPHDQTWISVKHDGSSLSIYIDPNTGRPLRIVTVGNMNLDNYGVDQTAKLIDHIPSEFPKGIKAIQCEALVDIDTFPDNPEASRQKANGLINSKYYTEDEIKQAEKIFNTEKGERRAKAKLILENNKKDEVRDLLILRAFRYYVDETTTEGLTLLTRSYKDVLGSLGTVKAEDGHLMFSPTDVWCLTELEKTNPSWLEEDKVLLSTAHILVDGMVMYNNSGQCQRALKFAGAGSGTEAIKTTVNGIQWNDQGPKGKDSWSANVLIDEVIIKGCKIKKPSAGSVSKLVKNNITPGAEVGIILANSTIPMVGEVFKAGNGEYNFPTCACGYQMSKKDIYGSNLKCGNPECTERLSRQIKSLGKDPRNNLDLNKLLVIDRFKWENALVDKSELLRYVDQGKEEDFNNYLKSFLKTDLQKRNLSLVVRTAWKALRIVLGYEDRK